MSHACGVLPMEVSAAGICRDFSVWRFAAIRDQATQGVWLKKLRKPARLVKNLPGQVDVFRTPSPADAYYSLFAKDETVAATATCWQTGMDQQESLSSELFFRRSRRARVGQDEPKLAGRHQQSGQLEQLGSKPMARKDAILNMRQVLLKRRDALRKALAGDLSLLKELREQTAGDVVDAALDSAQDEISSQLAQVESRELAYIENALEQMRDGKYGACESCETNIPLARLQALPYATLCIECQREAEKSGAASSMIPADWSNMLDAGDALVDM